MSVGSLIHPAWEVTAYGVRRGFTFELLGEIPFFLDLLDPRPAARQFDEAYQHGGGWRPLSGGARFVLDGPDGPTVYFPGDPPLIALAETYVPATAERVFFHLADLVTILQPTGEFEISRMD